MGRTNPVSADLEYWLGKDWTLADDMSSITIDLETNAEMGHIDKAIGQRAH